MSGPECEDSPFFRKADLDELEAVRLLNDSGFQFPGQRVARVLVTGDCHVSGTAALHTGFCSQTVADPCVPVLGWDAAGILSSPSVGGSCSMVLFHTGGCNLLNFAGMEGSCASPPID